MTNRDYKIMKSIYRKPHTLYEISAKFNVTSQWLKKAGSKDFIEGTTLLRNDDDFLKSTLELSPLGVELVETEYKNRKIRWFDRLFGFVTGIAIAAFGCWLTAILSAT